MKLNQVNIGLTKVNKSNEMNCAFVIILQKASLCCFIFPTEKSSVSIEIYLIQKKTIFFSKREEILKWNYLTNFCIH